MAAGPAFDRVVAVDGSASARPVTGADSIWIAVAECSPDRITLHEPVNPPTRAAAVDSLVGSCAQPGRTLVVVDWSLGYPVGTAAAFALDTADDAPWRAMHRHLAAAVFDGPDNRNDRFAVASDLNRRAGGPGPFWGATSRTATEYLTTTKQPFGVVGEWREAELRLRGQRRWPSSCWQLTGAGAVGSQSLLGIPRIAELRGRLAPRHRLAIWPFETGLRSPAADIDVVVAEMWPTLVATEQPLPEHPVRDAAQVMLAAAHFAELDRAGALHTRFSPVVEDPAAVVGEEGWILGLT